MSKLCLKKATFSLSLAREIDIKQLQRKKERGKMIGKEGETEIAKIE